MRRPHSVTFRASHAAAACALLILSACIQSPVPPPGGTLPQRLSRVENLYADARELYFQGYIADARGMNRMARGQSLAEVRGAYRTMSERILEQLGAIDSASYGAEDRRAIRVMRSTIAGSETSDSTSGAPHATDCTYDAAQLAAGAAGFETLSRRMYECYGEAARSVVTPTDTVDRLTVLARLADEGSGDARRALFVALQPMWRSVNGDNSARSPYRTLVGLSAARWKRDGSAIDQAARSLGFDASQTEATLVRILSTWRDRTPSTLIEPWDWWYDNGEASRFLSPRLGNRDALVTVNTNFYRDQGADLAKLGVRFDLEPRAGKTPVAFTQFGQPSRRRGREFTLAEAWVFATYRTGGFDNLIELLHETGHAIHISAISTRPAFADWPDSDPFTEALGDLLALEAYEPAWQLRYLGAAAPLQASLRAKYASITLDVAWALFELRMHRDPAADPNVVWSAITSEYLHIRPHPEWAWWAMRGQLLDAPGYMMNYALGALVTAAMRDHTRQAHGDFSHPDKKTYEWLSDRLYRWGQERPSRDVLRDFLGAPPSATALIDDMSRLTR